MAAAATNRGSALEYASTHHDDFLNKLKEFAAIPSISTESAHAGDIARAAEWLKGRLSVLGATKTQILETSGKPIVWAEIPPAASQAVAENKVPTVLIYGHYDVQPVDPLELWESDPFTPTERGDRIYGRGVSDMKGQVVACLSAVESIQKTGGLPLTLRFLIEGEEEIGSPSLAESLERYGDLFRADLCFNPDTGMLAPDKPTITYGLRGLAYFEITVTGPTHDLHSGGYGGVIHNPAQVLCELIAGMHDGRGRVTLPGFYDAVADVGRAERESLGKLGVTEESLRRDSGAPGLWGEKGYVPVERIMIRPTLEVNGISSGYTGEGAKTVLPFKAMAKISTRLVPNQDSKSIRGMLEAYIAEHAPDTVRIEVRELANGPGLISPTDSREIRAMRNALAAVWGPDIYFRRNGGSVPVSGYLKEMFDMPSVLSGFGLPDDNLHAPNEKLDLGVWRRGIDAVINFLFEYAVA